MCVIAIVPNGKSITAKQFELIERSNRDGIGFSFVNRKGRLRIYKSTKWRPEVAHSKFLKIQKLADSKFPVIVHFRAGSNVTKSNCHPFWISPNISMVHNGHIDIPQPYGQYSDTWHYSKFLQSQLGSNIDNLIHQKDYKVAIKASVGPNNKLAFLTTNQEDPVITIGDFVSLDGIQYSNLYWNWESNRQKGGYYHGGHWFDDESDDKIRTVITTKVETKSSDDGSSKTDPKIKTIYSQAYTYEMPHVFSYKTYERQTFVWYKSDVRTPETREGVYSHYYYIELKSGGDWPDDVKLVNLANNNFQWHGKNLHPSIRSAIITRYPNIKTNFRTVRIEYGNI